MRSILYLSLALTVAVIGCNRDEEKREPPKAKVKVRAPFVNIETTNAPPQTKVTDKIVFQSEAVVVVVKVTEPGKADQIVAIKQQQTPRCPLQQHVSKTCTEKSKTTTCQSSCKRKCERSLLCCPIKDTCKKLCNKTNNRCKQNFRSGRGCSQRFSFARLF